MLPCTCNAQNRSEHRPHTSDCLTQVSGETRWVPVCPDLWELMADDRCIARVIRFFNDAGNWSICYSHSKGIASSDHPSSFSAMQSIDENLNIVR